jgi:FMN phosphatase YigB (HAD superfamily)
VKIGNIDFDAVIFDLDGTLYSNKGFKKKLLLRSIRKLRTAYLMNKIRKRLMGVDFNSKDKFFKEFYAGIAGKSKRKIKKVEKWYKEDFYVLFVGLLKRKFTGRKNINELLKILKNNSIKLAVLSDYGHVKERLDALKIDSSLFEIIASNEDYGVLKPHKRPLIDIAEKLNVNTGKVLIVGDRDDTDGESARLAKMSYILISQNGKNHNENIYSWQKFHNQIADISKV